MKHSPKVGLAVLLTVISCGHPKVTGSRISTQSAPEASSSVQGSVNFTNSQIASVAEIADANPALMSAMKSVVQIQIKKPHCRNIEEDVVTLKKSRVVVEQTSFCTGTVIDYKGKPYVLTAAHCLVSSCINNDASKPSLTAGVNGKYNNPPSLAGIKIPRELQQPVKASPTSATSRFPIMDDFNWDDSTKVLTARDIEFVTGPVPTSIGKSFSGAVGGKMNATGYEARYVDTNACLANYSALSGSGIKYVAGSYDLAVIDFGPSLLTSYPAVSLPTNNFITDKVSATVPDGAYSSAKYRFMGVSHSHNDSFDLSGADRPDYFEHFQKSAHPANTGTCKEAQSRRSGNDMGVTLGTSVPFVGSSDYQDSFMMGLGASGCPGDSGGPMFEEVPVAGGYTYQLAGIQSLGYFTQNLPLGGHMAASRQDLCNRVESGTYTAIKPADINVALAKIAQRTVSLFPANSPKTSTGSYVDMWYPSPAGYYGYKEQLVVDLHDATAVTVPVTFSNSTIVLWKTLTKSDGVSKVGAQTSGNFVQAIATDGLGQRKATWKSASLAYGYYRVDIQYPKNINSASCLKLNYETNPLKVKTTTGSKVITIMAEGSPTFSLGAYSGNDIALGSPVKGVGIPAGATVAIVPTSRTSSTFTMSVAATATSASTGTPMIITHTFRNLVDQKTGYSPGVDAFMNVTQLMLPYKRTATIAAKYESNVWVPPLANTISPGSLTLIMHDKGCGTAAASAGRMSADTVLFTPVGGLK